MSARTLFLAAGMIALICSADAQQNPRPSQPPTELPRFPAPSAAPIAPPVVTAPSPPPEKSIEELLDELEQVQSQKAALEKKEQELKAAVLKVLEKQAERLNKLGAAPKTQKPNEQDLDRVGQIILEGFAANDETKIREVLGLMPGQILQYPKVEDGRVKLEKAGFAGVTIEVVPKGAGTNLKDIRIKSTAVPKK